MHDWRRALGEAVAGCAAEVRLDEPLAAHTTFRIGGPADAFVRANDRQSLVRVLQFCRANGVPWWVLGRGSNVLVSDQGLRGVVVILGGELGGIRVQDAAGREPGKAVAVRAGAGAMLDEVATVAEKEGLVGAEFLAGIPGTIGGGLQSNAGAFGRSLGDIVTSVAVLDRDGSALELSGSDLRREYRQPMVERGLVAVEVTMELAEGRPEPTADIRAQRWAKHPKEPSAGSFFRNPVAADGARTPAGRLIDQCGLKGRAVGGARVSEKHANFIINTGRARFADVYQLAQVVKAHVEEETGILLEEEVQYLPGCVSGPDKGQTAHGKVQNDAT